MLAPGAQRYETMTLLLGAVGVHIPIDKIPGPNELYNIARSAHIGSYWPIGQFWLVLYNQSNFYRF